MIRDQNNGNGKLLIVGYLQSHKNQAKWSYDKQTDHQKKAVIQNLNKVKL